MSCESAKILCYLFTSRVYWAHLRGHNIKLVRIDARQYLLVSRLQSRLGHLAPISKPCQLRYHRILQHSEEDGNLRIQQSILCHYTLLCAQPRGGEGVRGALKAVVYEGEVRTMRCGVVWCGVVWCGVVWCGVVGWDVVWVRRTGKAEVETIDDYAALYTSQDMANMHQHAWLTCSIS